MHAPSEDTGQNGHSDRFGPRLEESEFAYAGITNRFTRSVKVVDVQFHSRPARLREPWPPPAIIDPVGSTNHRSGTSARINDGRISG